MIVEPLPLMLTTELAPPARIIETEALDCAVIWATPIFSRLPSWLTVKIEFDVSAVVLAVIAKLPP